MYSEKDYIEKLFSEKFENYKFQTSEEEWNKLDVKLSKANFLKFSFVSFNVFYLAVFISFAGIATYFGITNYIQSEKIEALENEIELLSKQENLKEITPVIIKDTFYSEKKSVKTEKTSNMRSASVSKKVEIPQNIDEIKNHAPEEVAPSVIKPDSLYKKIDSISNLKPENQKVKRVKKTVFVKKDNVVIKDTIVVKKR